MTATWIVIGIAAWVVASLPVAVIIGRSFSRQADARDLAHQPPHATDGTSRRQLSA